MIGQPLQWEPILARQTEKFLRIRQPTPAKAPFVGPERYG